jgi:hypothetical protein
MTGAWMRVLTALAMMHLRLAEESDVEMVGEGDNDGESDDGEI